MVLQDYMLSFPFLTKNIRPSKIMIEKAEGSKFFDQKNRSYLDFSSQTLNLNFGQAHPLINQAIIREIKNFSYVSTRFGNPLLIQLARQLLSIAPAPLSRINLKLVNGSDANESAFKRVRKFRQKEYIISFHKSHLGESSETLSASGRSEWYIGGSNKFLFVNPPQNPEDTSLSEITFLLNSRRDIAGIILEPVMVNAGGFSFPCTYLKNLRKICDRFGISLIFDEIQTAFGWLGTYFAANYFGVEPDLITMGKGMAAGFPLSGILMKKEYDNLDYGEDEYTYGGHPLSCAAALACIKLLKETKIMEDAKEKGALLLTMLKNLKKRHLYIKDVRGNGLITGIEFINVPHYQNLAEMIYQECLKNGLVLRKTENGHGHSLVLKPPLIVTSSEIKQALTILDRAIKHCTYLITQE